MLISAWAGPFYWEHINLRAERRLCAWRKRKKTDLQKTEGEPGKEERLAPDEEKAQASDAQDFPHPPNPLRILALFCRFELKRYPCLLLDMPICS